MYDKTTIGRLTEEHNYLEQGFYPLFSDCDSTGKELDAETGYGYFGARYMDHELMMGWLSVDPMADKYPNVSPYAYCAWNPVKLVDPDGNDWYETENGAIKWTDCHNQNELKNSGVSGSYLGVTADDGNVYYGLMGDRVSKAKEGERYRLTKDIDQAIINRSLSSSAYKSNEVDFSNVFPFEYGPKSSNTRSGYSYAGGEAGIAMNGKTDNYGKRIGMMGCFNDMRKNTGRSLNGASPTKPASLGPPRFSINCPYLIGGKEIVGISFANAPNKADRFEKIYEGLKGRPLLHAQRNDQRWTQTRYR